MRESGTVPEIPPHGATNPPTSNRSALLIVFLVIFIDLLGFGIVLPMLPWISVDYVERLLHPESTGGASRGDASQDPIVGLTIGLLLSSFSFMQFLFSPLWGRISDRIGRRPVLLLGLVGSVVFYALFGWATSLPPEYAAVALVLFFVARIGAGLSGATIATAQAVIADSTPPEKRKHGMALIGAAFGIGFTFGPLIGAGALTFFKGQLEVVGYSASLLSLVALILATRLLPETRQFDAAPPKKHGWLRFFGLRKALANGAIRPVVLTFFLATLGFGAFEATLALLLKDCFEMVEKTTFLMFSFVGLVLMVTQGVLYRRLAQRWSEVAFITAGLLLMAGGVGALGLVTYLATNGNPMYSLLFPALTLAVMGFAFLTPSTNALISRRTDPNKQGEILGVNQSAASMARILGPILGVTLYKSTSTHLLPYALGAGLLLLMLPLIPRISRG